MHTAAAWIPNLGWAAIAAIAWMWAAAPGPAAESPEPLRSIADVLTLTPAEIAAEPPAIVRGVVTWAHGWIVIEDDEAAIFVAGLRTGAGGSPPVSPEVGDELEIEGSVVAGGYAPLITRAHARVVGRRPVPPAQPADLGRLLRGLDIGRRVIVQGVVQGFVKQPWD